MHSHQTHTNMFTKAMRGQRPVDGYNKQLWFSFALVVVILNSISAAATRPNSRRRLTITATGTVAFCRPLQLPHNIPRHRRGSSSLYRPSARTQIIWAMKRPKIRWLSSSNSDTDEEENGNINRRQRIRQRVSGLVKNIVIKPISAVPLPTAVATILKDATLDAVDLAVEEVTARRTSNNPSSTAATNDGTSIEPLGIETIVNDAFAPMEQSLAEMEASLETAKVALVQAKIDAVEAMEALQAAAIAEAQGAATVVAAAEEAAERKVIAEIYANTADASVDVSSIALEDLEFSEEDMAPPFLDEDQCLVPGEPVVRVEKAPENSRRIFAGIDIMASVDDVWNVLTDYSHLQRVVPNLVVNEVLKLYPGSARLEDISVDSSQEEENQCRELSRQMKGAMLKQVGGAKVAGINFSARTTLEVREWPRGLPDFAHFNDEIWQGKARQERVAIAAKTKLARYRFPRPFAVSSLPTKDISMQSIAGDDGEFRMYQGVWRMQPLPGCAPDGKSSMRLTYAVEVSPRAYLPVQLIEGRIVRDLCTNLSAIRDYLNSSSTLQTTERTAATAGK